jgi:hypothetical protein
MGDGDVGGPHPLRNGVEMIVPGRPRPRLHRFPWTPPARVEARNADPQPQTSRLRHDGCRIAVGCASPKAVVDVGDMQSKAQPITQADQGVKEDHGIHPTRDGRQEALPRAHAGLP